MRAIGFIMLFWLCTSVVLAQDEEESSSSSVEFVEEEYQTEEEPETEEGPTLIRPDYTGENVDVKPFEKSQWKKVVGDADYSENPEKQKNLNGDGASGGESEKRADSNGAEDESNSSFTLPPWSGEPLQLLSYIIIIVLISVILYFVIKNIPARSVSAVGKLPVDHQNIENIEDLDVNNLLKKALADGNYRLAIRLYYLALLKALHEKTLIRWEKDKTNREYLAELYNRDELYDDVKGLTLTYEKVWYGEYPIGKDTATVTISGFEKVQQKISLTVV